MQSIKRYLFAWLGRERYLFLVSRLYFTAYRWGALRNDPEYELHYFVRKLVRKGDWVIDIGANLGYYSVLFADLAGPQGKVFSVEPVPLYRRVLERNLGGRSNVAIVPYALGEREGSVLMGIPGEQPYRHGLTRVLDEAEQETTGHHFEVRIRPPQQLFGELERLDYIKCDVEGYEHHVLPPMEEHIRRFRPIVQVELAPENRTALFELFAAATYRAFYVQGQRLHPLPEAATPSMGDVLFIPSEKIAGLAEFISA